MPYDNRRREESARSTRARVLDAARASFLDRGFGATTVRGVAEAAGVSQETVYKSFGGKAGLLKAVYDVTLVGDDEEVPLRDRPEAIAVRDATDPATAAAAYAALAMVVAARIDPLLRVVAGARDTDRALADFVRTTDEERRAGASFYVRHWAEAGWLRDGVTVDRAIDSVWALNSAEPRWLLLDAGWSRDEYAAWLGGLIARTIFRGDR